MVNLITIYDQNDRKALIEAEMAISKKQEGIVFRGKMRDLPVIRIPIDIPVYRMRNGRTQVDQFLMIEERKLPKDFFESGEENISAQRLQHEILLSLSKDEKGPIYQELEHVAGQRHNLVITCHGVLLNGNRRLAAMRDLYASNPREFSSFSHVDAVVLPPETKEQDLELLEAELQLAPETKLEYGWIQRRLKLKYQLEVLRISRDEIKKIYRFKREEDMNVELQQLTLAEEYLEKYLGRPYAYREVAKSEQLFKDLQKALSGKSGEGADLRRLTGFLLAKEARNLGDRVYGYNAIFGKEFDDVMYHFAIDEGLELKDGDSSQQLEVFVDDDDPLSGIGTQQPSTYAPLKPFLTDQSKTQVTAEKLTRIYDSVRAGKSERNTQQLALKKVQDALRLLNEIDLNNCDPSTHGQIIGQLDAIVKIAGNLLKDLNTISQCTDEAS